MENKLFILCVLICWGWSLSGAPYVENPKATLALANNSVELQEVQFEAYDFVNRTNWIVIKNDDGQSNISGHSTTVVWDANGKRVPVAYVSGTTAVVSAQFELQCDGTNDHYVKAENPDGFHLKAKKLGEYQGEWYYTSYNVAKKFDKNKVQFWENFELTWYYSNSINGPWVEIGRSEHPLYVTHKKPTMGGGYGDNTQVQGSEGIYSIHQTSIHYSCKAADGRTGEQSVVDRIFKNYFEDLDAKNIGGEPLTYWGKGKDSSCGNIPYLLIEKDGTCGTWREYMKEMLLIHGINSTSVDILPDPKEYTPAQVNQFKLIFQAKYPNAEITVFRNSFFMVKNWLGGNGQNGDYIDLGTDKDLWQHHPGDLGIRAQNMIDPTSIFTNHAFLEYNSVFYDPSYGVKLNSNEIYVYEDAALDIVEAVFFITTDLSGDTHRMYVNQVNTLNLAEIQRR